MRSAMGQHALGRRLLVVVTIGSTIVWGSARPAFSKPADGGSQTTRPVIAEDVSPVESIAPISRDGHRGEGFVRKPPAVVHFRLRS